MAGEGAEVMRHYLTLVEAVGLIQSKLEQVQVVEASDRIKSPQLQAVVVVVGLQNYQMAAVVAVD